MCRNYRMYSWIYIHFVLIDHATKHILWPTLNCTELRGIKCNFSQRHKINACQSKGFVGWTTPLTIHQVLCHASMAFNHISWRQTMPNHYMWGDVLFTYRNKPTFPDSVSWLTMSWWHQTACLSMVEQGLSLWEATWGLLRFRSLAETWLSHRYTTNPATASLSRRQEHTP